jgi:aerotaxis receptor
VSGAGEHAMSTNRPVTQQELEFPEGATLMSTTDTKGRITYANEAFIEISGYSRAELQGQPHNLVRHPDIRRKPSPTCGPRSRAANPGPRW